MKTQWVGLRQAVPLLVVWMIGSWSLSCQGQNTPRLSVSLGPSYVLFDSKSVGFANDTSLLGGIGDAAFNVTHSFGIMGQIYADYGDHVHLKGWMAGPQVYHPKWHGLLLAHALFGKTQTRIETIVGNREFETGISWAAGGGYEFPISQHFSVRPVMVEYLHTSDFGGQGNLRVSGGLEYRWGELKRHVEAP